MIAKTMPHNDGRLIKDNMDQKISILVYPFLIFISLTIINTFQFGASLSGVIVPVVIFFTCILFEKGSFQFTNNHFICLLFWLLAAVSTLLSDIIVTQRDILTFLVFCLFFIACTAKEYNKLELKVIVLVYICIAVICSINIIWNFSIDYAYGWKRYSVNLLGVHRDPNYVAAFIVPAAGILFYRILMGEKMKLWKQALYCAAFILTVMGCIGTGSRAALFIFCLLIVITLLNYLAANRNAMMPVKIIIIIGLFILGWQLLMNLFPDFLITRLTDFDNYSNDLRWTLWSSGIHLFMAYPVLGAGLGSLTLYLYSVGLLDSHNVYLDILSEQGLIGITLLGLMFYGFIKVKNKDRLFMLVLVLGFFAPLFFINGFNTASFWTPMILCQIFSNYSKRSEQGILPILNQL